MRNNICILFSLVLSLFTVPSGAGDLKKFPRSPTQMATERIEGYLRRGALSTAGSLDEIEVHGLSGIHLALRLILEHLEPRQPLRPQKMRHLQAVLHQVVLMAKAAGPNKNLHLREAVKLQADELLKALFNMSESTSEAVEIFDRLELWSPGNMWFLEKMIAQAGSLNDHRLRILNLLPELSEDQLDSLALQVRSHRMDPHLRLSLLFDIGRIRPVEQTKLLLVLADQFANKSMDTPEEKSSPLKIFFEKRTDLILGHTVNHLMYALHLENPSVVESYQRAFDHLSRQNATLNREPQLRFLNLLRDPNFDWLNRSTWRIPPLYEVEGNVVRLSFSPAKNCEGELE